MAGWGAGKKPTTTTAVCVPTCVLATYPPPAHRPASPCLASPGLTRRSIHLSAPRLPPSLQTPAILLSPRCKAEDTHLSQAEDRCSSGVTRIGWVNVRDDKASPGQPPADYVGARWTQQQHSIAAHTTRRGRVYCGRFRALYPTRRYPLEGQRSAASQTLTHRVTPRLLPPAGSQGQGLHHEGLHHTTTGRSTEDATPSVTTKGREKGNRRVQVKSTTRYTLPLRVPLEHWRWQR
ncbi:hypothetical protein E2C01_040679 [Portunus trituberculatus]|uniref:Uncharacterized protein n=1 Tax=Portunus trituberculatus TaxID=210409 RepID=A0A5B7FNM0_PORTR|nr:hypothetical protein [Portunus trituberculatus]